MSEDIGRHKGAVETLLHEKKELSRLLKIVNSQLERHLSALEDRGVDTEEFIENLQREQQSQQSNQQQQRQRSQKMREKENQDRSDSSGDWDDFQL